MLNKCLNVGLGTKEAPTMEILSLGVSLEKFQVDMKCQTCLLLAKTSLATKLAMSQYISGPPTLY